MPAVFQWIDFYILLEIISKYLIVIPLSRYRYNESKFNGTQNSSALNNTLYISEKRKQLHKWWKSHSYEVVVRETYVTSRVYNFFLKQRKTYLKSVIDNEFD